MDYFPLMRTFFPGFSFAVAALLLGRWVALLLMALLGWVWMV
jgi:hypothetical protein